MSNSVAGELTAILGSAAVCAASAPYLASLVHTTPDRDDPRRWRPLRTERAEVVRTAVVAAVLGALAGAAAGWTAVLPAFVVLAWFATPLVLIDVARHRLPARLVHPLAGSALVLFAVAAAVTGRWSGLMRVVLAAVVVAVVLYVLHRASPRSFGFGDVRLGAVLSGYLGWFGWPAVLDGLFAGFVVGALAALTLVITRRATLKSAVPFGPALVLGALLVLSLDLVPAGTG